MPNFKTMEGRTVWEEENTQQQSKWFDTWFSLWAGIGEESVNGWRSELESEIYPTKPKWEGTATTGLGVDGGRFKPTKTISEIEVLPEIINGQFGGVLVSGFGDTERVPLFILHYATEKYQPLYERCKGEGLPFAFYFLGTIKKFIVRQCIEQAIIPYPVEECDHDIALG